MNKLTVNLLKSQRLTQTDPVKPWALLYPQQTEYALCTPSCYRARPVTAIKLEFLNIFISPNMVV